MDETDELNPLIEEDHKRRNPLPRKFVFSLLAAGIAVVLLLSSTASLSVLYFSLRQEVAKGLPRWPDPSLSRLGKFAKASVAADNEYCSEIGRNVLLKGGNAVDAAIAALFCIGVMDSHSAGIGGGHFMTIYNATTKKCSVVDARETAPAAARKDMFTGRWNDSQVGWLAIAVPGELHGLWTEYTTFGGHIPWKELITPTIELMEEGFPTSHALAKALKSKEAWIQSESTMKAFINPKTGRVYDAGEQIVSRANFIETLKQLANSSDPVKLFYYGQIAHSVVREFRNNGGILTLDDFRGYKSVIRDDNEVIVTKLRNGRTICGPPPPSGAAVAQAILNILDGYKNSVSSFEETVSLFHRFIEASKFAYAARSALGDIEFVDGSIRLAKNISTNAFAQRIRSMITDETHPDSYYGGSFEGASEDHGTTHISVIDAHGNSVSVTSTINLYLGAAVMSESTGILWNDEMDDFSMPGHPNYFGFPPSPANFIYPGKRPMSSMSPIVIYSEHDHEQQMSVGGAGGSTIISGVAGVALRALWLGEDVKRAVDAPRLHNQLQPNVTLYEDGFPKKYVEALRKRGHVMESVRNLTVVTAVERTSDGVIYANSDFRKGEESSPAGY